MLFRHTPRLFPFLNHFWSPALLSEDGPLFTCRNLKYLYVALQTIASGCLKGEPKNVLRAAPAAACAAGPHQAAAQLQSNAEMTVDFSLPHKSSLDSNKYSIPHSSTTAIPYCF